jgi:hypothetical protein
VSAETSLIVEHEKGRVKIQATAAPGGLISVTRTHPSGRVVTVRSMNQAAMSGGAFIGWDYESPIGVPVTYQASYYADADTFVASSNTQTVTWITELDWLKDPLEPIRNMPISINDMSTLSYQTPTGVFPVLGRPAPVTVGEIRQAAAGDVIFATGDHSEALRLHYLTASGHTLLLQSSQASGVGSMYIAPLNFVENRVLPLRDEEARYWTLTYQEVDPPVGDAQGSLTTYADLLAQSPTYQDIVDTFPTYLALIEGLAGSQPAPTLQWRGS